MTHCYIKQLEERIVPNEIDILSWSEHMDLVAFSNIKGEVALHRLNWTRVWSLAAPKEDDRMKALSWKPDGKTIAIAYSSGQILLLNIENKSTINKLDVPNTITCMEWASERTDGKSSSDKLTSEEEDQNNVKDTSSIFLPDPPPLSNLSSFFSSDQENTYTMTHKETKLNILAIGTEEGIIYISIFGCLPFITYNLSEKLGYVCSVINIRFSRDLNYLYATVIDDVNTVKIIIIETDIFKTHSKELFLVCMKHECINSIIYYLDNTIELIKETWESILLEMDMKLSNYASKVPTGTLSTDFLDLLVFGAVSDLMHKFLLIELTKKGLEKFGQTIEASYASIQKLLLRNVSKIGQNITYHLSELRGMSRFKDRYEILGLNEDKITEAILATGSFLTKSGEMQLIINSSIANYKAFFQWLYTVIMNITDEPIPSEIPKMTQDDLVELAEFVQNFDNINHGGVKTGFAMERLGQYLENSPLQIPSGIEKNEWNSFLDENECLRNLPNVINHSKDTSLIQEFKQLDRLLKDCFDNLKHSIVNQFKIKEVIEVYELGHQNLKLSNISPIENKISYAFLIETSRFLFLDLTIEEEISIEGGIVSIPHSIQFDSKGNFEILSLQFYTSNVLSLLLQENNSDQTGVLCQMSASSIRERISKINISGNICSQDLIKIDASVLGNSVLKSTEGMVCSDFAITGSRKVSIVLAENKRKVRIYEMEADEDEEEDGDITNSMIREGDVSMLEEEENSNKEC